MRPLHGVPVLVTGSSGFIGLPVGNELTRQGAVVLGVDPQAPDEPIRFRQLDYEVGDKQLLLQLLSDHQIQIVVHCAGISGQMLERDNPFLVWQANVTNTMNLVEASRRAGLQRFIYCSSAAAFGDTPPPPVPDDAPLRPKDVYGATKGSVDLLLAAYREQFDFPGISLRLSNGYGPRRRTRCAIRTMLSDALNGRATRLDWGLGYGRPYLFVDDAVSAIVAAASSTRADALYYNVASSEFPTMDSIAEIIREIVPTAQITLGHGPDPQGYRRSALDISAAARDLGFVPAYDMKAGISKYAAWMRTMGHA